MIMIRGTSVQRALKRGTLRVGILIAWLVILFPRAASPLDTVKQGDTLGLAECIAIALKNHPSLMGAQGNLMASRSRVGEARSGYYPQVNASSSLSRNKTADTAEKRGQTRNQYDSSIDLEQTIFDFGRTSTRVEVQSLGAKASEADLSDTTRQVVFGVKQAYFGILQAKQGVLAYTEEVKQLDLHLAQATRFYEVGRKSKIDVTNAQVNLGRSRLNLLNAQNALRIARIGLNNAMGLPDAPVFEVAEGTGFQDYRIDLDEALKRGFEARPDLQSARKRREAAERTVDLARKGYYPKLSGNAGYGFSGEDYPLDDGWSLGATLSIPLFNGFLTRHQVEGSKANVMMAKSDEELIRQGIRFDIEQAYVTLKNVREKIALAELTLKQAREYRELAMGRYRSGVGDSIEVADAVLAETNANTAYITTLYDYRIAVANLEKAMGGNG